MSLRVLKKDKPKQLQDLGDSDSTIIEDAEIIEETKVTQDKNIPEENPTEDKQILSDEVNPTIETASDEKISETQNEQTSQEHSEEEIIPE